MTVVLQKVGPVFKKCGYNYTKGLKFDKPKQKGAEDLKTGLVFASFNLL